MVLKTGIYFYLEWSMLTLNFIINDLVQFLLTVNF